MWRRNKAQPKEEHPAIAHPELSREGVEPQEDVPDEPLPISEYTDEPYDPEWALLRPPAPSVDRRLIGKEYQ